MSKQYNSVIDLIKDSLKDSEFVKELSEEIHSKQISKTLFSMRCRIGLTQEEVAKRMNCSQSKISKIEHSNDLELTINDIVSYSSAVNMCLEIGFSDQRMTMVDRIKYHFFKLKALLDDMIDMAKGDEAMERGAAKFATEAFVNVNFGLLECLKKVKTTKEEKLPLHVSSPVNIDELHSPSKKEIDYIF